MRKVNDDMHYNVQVAFRKGKKGNYLHEA